LHANHAVIRAGHAYIRLVRSAFWQNTVIGGWDMSVCSQNCGDASIQIPAQGDFFRCRLSVDVHHNYFAADLPQQFIGFAKGIFMCLHENPPLEVDDRIILTSLCDAFKHAYTGNARGVICRTQHAART
jgi:hypothetical protein